MQQNSTLQNQRWVITDSRMVVPRHRPAPPTSKPEESALTLVMKKQALPRELLGPRHGAVPWPGPTMPHCVCPVHGHITAILVFLVSLTPLSESKALSSFAKSQPEQGTMYSLGEPRALPLHSQGYRRSRGEEDREARYCKTKVHNKVRSVPFQRQSNWNLFYGCQPS